MSTVIAGNLFSQYIYEVPKDRQVNFYCTEFQKILDIINDTLFKYDVPSLSFNSAGITRSKYDIVAEFKCTSMWRVTSDMYPALSVLCISTVNKELKQAIFKTFPNYLGEIIKINTYNTGTKASIVIMPGGLAENTYTEEDLLLYGKDEIVTARLNLLEDRMYRRANDTRPKFRRWADFIEANKYESVLPLLTLKGVSALTLKHNTKRFSIDPPAEPDFSGILNGMSYSIEAKSTKDIFNYDETAEGKKRFVEYWKTKQASLGSLHNADYILFIFKSTGNIICLERLNPNNNWRAGKLVFSEELENN